MNTDGVNKKRNKKRIRSTPDFRDDSSYELSFGCDTANNYTYEMKLNSNSLKTEEQRSRHNKISKKGRQKINNQITRLKEMVFTSDEINLNSCNKAFVLHCAVGHIEQLKSYNRRAWIHTVEIEKLYNSLWKKAQEIVKELASISQKSLKELVENYGLVNSPTEKCISLILQNYHPDPFVESEDSVLYKNDKKLDVKENHHTTSKMKIDKANNHQLMTNMGSFNKISAMGFDSIEERPEVFKLDTTNNEFYNTCQNVNNYTNFPNRKEIFSAGNFVANKNMVIGANHLGIYPLNLAIHPNNQTIGSSQIVVPSQLILPLQNISNCSGFERQDYSDFSLDIQHPFDDSSIFSGYSNDLCQNENLINELQNENFTSHLRTQI